MEACRCRSALGASDGSRRGTSAVCKNWGQVGGTLDALGHIPSSGPKALVGGLIEVGLVEVGFVVVDFCCGWFGCCWFGCGWFGACGVELLGFVGFGFLFGS